MTWFPQVVDLRYFEEVSPHFPFFISLNRVDSHFPAHRHDFLECSFVLGGSGVEIINGVSHPMEKGTFTFLLPYQMHELIAHKGTPLELYNCMFALDLLLPFMEQMPLLHKLLLDSPQEMSPFIKLDAQERARFTGLFAQLLNEFQQTSPWRDTFIRVKLMEMLIEFDRTRNQALTHRLAPAAILRTGSTKDDDMWSILLYIHHNYKEELKLHQLAKHFHRKENRLSEEIKRYAGKNFVELLHEIRIRHACALLASTDLHMSDIAVEIGYGSTQTFFRTFKEVKGQSPGVYRKQIGQHQR
ncbi:hypothetical protein A8709_14285 [Paenibacillus pectinilyticus]|uniref:HTH araC/xylS-type domain-containing protein n=1 Tax=Paenibacillus pectinilyticus TaxID=512399 RepID=A0A1C1A3Y2_9BACL|nr:helix-turn-helix domain-containing protein [Paenibacillus pectinilyticus]OCT15263.1 hypothetical protein A8709_14285 [Paenibacillus pectinilyticus]